MKNKNFGPSGPDDCPKCEKQMTAICTKFISLTTSQFDPSVS